MMRITQIRLINFHNFIDETIEVAEGGHLFLLGDNGSGKTTVLDAVHYVLSGAQLELNAAARVGGRKDEGRSIQGVVLRSDFERGVRNEGGAIAYAAIELVDPERDQRLVLGVGIEATTMEARVTKWGVVSTRPLAELPLVVERDGARHAASREGLAAALGPAEVFLRIGDYRASVAARLFGGPDRYREATEFWSMAKAYREIVAGARDFGGLFRRLLPPPDPRVFGEILRSLHKIGEMEDALGALDAQRAYVAGLIELSDEVATQREAACRYEWLAAHLNREATSGALRASEERSAELTAQRARLGAAVDAAEAKVEAADAGVRSAQAEDPDGVATKLADAERLARGKRAETVTADGEAAMSRAAAANAERLEAEARAALGLGIDRGVVRLGAAIDAASKVPGDLPRSRALVQGMTSAPPSGWLAAIDEAQREVTGVVLAARERADDARERLERDRMRQEHCAVDLAELRRVQEEQPRVPGFAEATAELVAAGIDAQPIYELCEPTVGADPARLAWLEALAGDDALASLVVAPEDAQRATALVAARAPGVRVIVRTVAALALPAWATPLFGNPSKPGQATAVRALAAAVAQAEGLGDVAPADDRGVLEHRGAAFAPPRTAPRLFGRTARLRVHAARIEAAEQALGAAARAVEKGEDTLRIATGRVTSLERLLEAVREAHSPALATAESQVRATADTAALRRQLAAEASDRAASAHARLQEIQAQVDALTARAAAMNLAELQARIRELETMARRAREAWRDLQSRYGVCESDLQREAARREVLEAQRGAFEQELGRLAAKLCTLVAGLEPGQVDRYVRVTKGGDRFESLAAVEGRMNECRRGAQAAADELSRDGSRGVLHIHYAARFGFGYDAVANRLTDRRDQPASGVLAGLERTLGEQRGVITAESRELMETLVMSSLARDLQAQTERLARMVKDTNRLLAGIRFGRSEYQFRAVPRADRRDLVDVVGRISVLDADSRAEFRAWIEDRIEELRGLDEDVVPELLDYRSWYDFSLRLRSEGTDGVDLTHSVRVLGSGGEQGVPNYLLVLALGALMYDSSGSKLRPLMFDEAFYGIDAGRRDQLLRFATELGLQILVASPDQDGVTPSVRAATTLFIVKDAHGDVHLAPYHYWHREAAPQADLFAPPEASEPAAESAECRT